MKFKYFFVFLITSIFILSCYEGNSMVKIRMEVYYNVFENAFSEDIKFCRALIRIPVNDLQGKAVDDNLVISFLEKGDNLIYHVSNNGESDYKINGKVIGKNNETEEAYISFDFFPLKIKDKEYDKIKYEKGFTKYIYIYFNSKLKYQNFEFLEKTKIKPVMFK